VKIPTFVLALRHGWSRELRHGDADELVDRCPARPKPPCPPETKISVEVRMAPAPAGALLTGADRAPRLDSGRCAQGLAPATARSGRAGPCRRAPANNAAAGRPSFALSLLAFDSARGELDERLLAQGQTRNRSTPRTVGGRLHATTPRRRRRRITLSGPDGRSGWVKCAKVHIQVRQEAPGLKTKAAPPPSPLWTVATRRQDDAAQQRPPRRRWATPARGGREAARAGATCWAPPGRSGRRQVARERRACDGLRI
jgi:hypothetical protein